MQLHMYVDTKYSLQTGMDPRVTEINKSEVYLPENDCWYHRLSFESIRGAN